MAFSSANLPRQIVTGGIFGSRDPNVSISGGGNIFLYTSSDGSTAVGGVAGYFAGCGAQPSSGQGQGVLARSPNNVGMRFGDLLVNVESSAGAAPGRVTWHAAKGSTFNQASTSGSSAIVASAGFDITVSSATT